jgi:hypothetical protein
MKMTQAGSYVWAKRIGVSGGYVASRGLDTDSSGNIFITGTFSVGPVDFGNGVPVGPIGYPSSFIAKYSSNGTYQWVKKIGISDPCFPTGPCYVRSGGLAVDSVGNVVIAGEYGTNADMGGPTRLVHKGTALNGLGWEDIFVAKYSGSDGSYMWAKGYGARYMEYLNGIAIGTGDSIAITGNFYYPFSLGGPDIPSGTSFNTFISNYTSNGDFNWSRAINGNQVASKSISQSTASVYVLGSFRTMSGYGGSTLTGDASNGYGFIMRVGE